MSTGRKLSKVRLLLKVLYKMTVSLTFENYLLDGRVAAARSTCEMSFPSLFEVCCIFSYDLCMYIYIYIWIHVYTSDIYALCIYVWLQCAARVRPRFPPFWGLLYVYLLVIWVYIYMCIHVIYMQWAFMRGRSAQHRAKRHFFPYLRSVYM